MIEIRDLTLHRGSRTLFEKANLTAYPGQKIGITGANGTGKSTLFALLLGDLQVDAGIVKIPSHWNVISVAQEVAASDRTAIDYVMDGDVGLRAIQAALAAAERADDGKQLGVLHDRLAAVDGYTARSRAAELLNGLGFSPTELEQPVRTFSGGWRMRLNLARALMCRSDLLLLDEPTNHLDLDAVLWLERWLGNYPGTLLLISHDRDFLDNCVDHIGNLEQRRIELYPGNYAQFERQRAERLAQQTKTAEKQAREIAHIRAFVERFRAKATKARQAQSRLKALARMETIAAAEIDSPFHFAFRDPGRCAHPLLQLEEVQAGYSTEPVLRDIALSLNPGDRLGLLGRNGAGKSTLIKTLAGELLPLEGKLRLASGLRIGYFAQHQLDRLRPEDGALVQLQRLAAKEAAEQEIRDYLGGFGFTGDNALRPVDSFSGGERARLALALLVWQRPHVLLLDEPTNHLDLRMRDALVLALQDFPGALVLVSHDRHLLRATTDRLALVTDGGICDFAGDLDDYREWLLKASPNLIEAAAKPAGDHMAANRKEKRRQEAELRAQQRPLVKQLAKVEKEIERLEKSRQDLEGMLAGPDLYQDNQKARLKETLFQQAQVCEQLIQAEEEWLQLSESLEPMQ